MIPEGSDEPHLPVTVDGSAPVPLSGTSPADTTVAVVDRTLCSRLDRVVEEANRSVSRAEAIRPTSGAPDERRTTVHG